MGILIMGYGEMGQAMECLLSPHHEIRVWQRRQPIDLAQAINGCLGVFFCVPAGAITSVLTALTPYLPANGRIPLISIAKGLDEQGRYAARILADEAPTGYPWAVIYGPMISEELRTGKTGFAQVAGTRVDTAVHVRELFKQTALHLEFSDDVTGMSWCAILKNAYTLLFGAADALEMGDNMRGMLAAHTLRELASIITHQGGDAGTVARLAGVGDLITTATSAGSHHYALGRRLAAGDKTDIRGEGVHSIQMIENLGILALETYPLLSTAVSLLHAPAQARTLFQQYVATQFDKR